MKIEDITPETVAKADKNELHALRLRFNQLWSKHFEGCQKSAVGTLTRELLLQQYGLLIKEIRKRTLTYYTKAIDRALFKNAMMGLDVPSLDDVVIVPDYVAVGGAFAKTAFDVEIIDVVIREDKDNCDKNLESKISALISKQTDKKCRFIYSPAGIQGPSIPLFDKVLRAKAKTVRTVHTKTAKSQHKSTSKWSDESVASLQALLPFLKSGDRILDVGGSTSCIMSLLSKYGYDVTAADNSDIEKRNLPFDDNEFDLVIGTCVIERSDNPEQLISESHRIAKRHSLFIIPIGKSGSTPNKQVYKHLSDLRVLFKHTTATAEWIKGSKSIALVAAKKSSNSSEGSDTIIKTEDSNERNNVFKREPTLKEKLNARQTGMKKEHYVLNKSLRLLPVKKDATEHIVYGVVWEPETTDSQDDIISEDEIRKAAYQFMEETQIFKVNHEGNEVSTRILENFIAPDDFVVNGLPVKKGSWVLAVRVLNQNVWQGITNGLLTGYSVAGTAERGDTE